MSEGPVEIATGRVWFAQLEETERPMSMAAEADKIDVEEVSEEEGHALFDQVSRRFLRMSGAEFLIKWDRGEFEGDDRPEVTHVAMLIPFGR